MQPEEFLDQVHFVKEPPRIPLEREQAPREQRITNPNLWESCDWLQFDTGKLHGDWGVSPQSANPFYLLGHTEGFKKYLPKTP